MMRPFVLLSFLDPYLEKAYAVLRLSDPGDRGLLKGFLVAVALLLVIGSAASWGRTRREDKRRESRIQVKLRHGSSRENTPAPGLSAASKKEQADRLLEAGDTLQAGRLYEEARWYTLAATAYKRGRHWPDLARMYEATGKCVPAARAYESAGRPYDAARAYLKGEDPASAAEIFQKIEDFDKAGQAFEKAGKLLEAAGAYERWVLTATDPGENGPRLLQRSGSLYAQIGQYERAVGLFERAGAFVEAADACANLRDFKRAADFLIRSGRRKLAVACLEKVGDQRQALEVEAETLRTQGALEEAGRRYQLLEDHYEAADLFRRCGRLVEAAQQYEQGGYLREAAELYEQIGSLEEAQRLFRLSSCPSKAAGLLVRLGRLREALDLYLVNDEPFQAAEVYRLLGDNAEATRVLAKIPRSHAQYAEAAPLLGSLLVEAGDPVQAKAVLVDFLVGRPLDLTTRAAHLDLARAHEGLEEGTACLELLYRVQGLDPTDAEIQARIERCRDDFVHRSTAASPTPVIVLGPAEEGESDLPVVSVVPEEKMDRYELHERLGAGGMGEVFKAKDRVLERWVAIKFLRSVARQAGMTERFMREARAAARVSHPNIVKVFDVGSGGENVHIVMEYVEGESVRRLLRRLRRVPVARTIAIARQVAAGLSAAHAAGLVHRDVKPDNILLTPEGSAKLADFGIVHIEEHTITAPGMVIGTMRYMSPEQITGDWVDGRADLYALGVTLYEMIVGTVPFAEGDVSHQHVCSTPPSPSEAAPGIPGEVEGMILKLLEKKPEDRYPSAGALEEHLAQIEKALGP